MRIIFLGTSSMVPTKERAHSGVVLEHDIENILFDCGESIQRQLRISGSNINRITKILLTHWHADHVLGLPGLLQTMAKQKENKKIDIFGPKGTKKFINYMMKAFVFYGNLNMKIKEISKGTFFKNNLYSLESITLKHTVPTLGYSFKENDRRKININYLNRLGLKKGPLIGKLQQGKDVIFKGKKIYSNDATSIIKGKKISYIVDTLKTRNVIKLAKDSDVLICESTFKDESVDKAKKSYHLTSTQAAEIAKEADVKLLILTHFSQRYKNVKELENESKKTFKNTIAAKDFMILEIIKNNFFIIENRKKKKIL